MDEAVVMVAFPAQEFVEPGPGEPAKGVVVRDLRERPMRADLVEAEEDEDQDVAGP